MQNDSHSFLKNLPLSNRSVRRIHEMADDVQNTLVSEIRNCKLSKNAILFATHVVIS